MKKTALATMLVTALSVGAAYAAAPSTPTTPATPPAAGAGAGGAAAGANTGASATFTLQTADATKLKDWIMQQKTASVAAPAGFSVAVGATLPASIMLHAIPASAGVTAAGSNQYAVVADKMVLVNPTDRKIVYVFA